MGLYINPKTDTTSRSKRETILAVARPVSLAEFVSHPPGAGGEYGVAICDNGFIAAGIAFSKHEAEAFARAYGDSAEYVMLTKEQIAEMDPGAAEALD